MASFPSVVAEPLGMLEGASELALVGDEPAPASFELTLTHSISANRTHEVCEWDEVQYRPILNLRCKPQRWPVSPNQNSRTGLGNSDPLRPIQEGVEDLPHEFELAVLLRIDLVQVPLEVRASLFHVSHHTGRLGPGSNSYRRLTFILEKRTYRWYAWLDLIEMAASSHRGSIHTLCGKPPERIE